jgi:hypothetical protein
MNINSINESFGSKLSHNSPYPGHYKAPSDFSGWAFPIYGLELAPALSRDLSDTYPPINPTACGLISGKNRRMVLIQECSADLK